jgi:hypothetical protein
MADEFATDKSRRWFFANLKAQGYRLPERSADTMSDAIAMSSPNGSMSKRAQEAAQERLRQDLFGKDGLQISAPTVTDANKARQLRARAEQLRNMANGGFKPRVHRAEADRLDSEAAALEAKSRPSAAPRAEPINHTDRFVASAAQRISAQIDSMTRSGIDRKTAITVVKNSSVAGPAVWALVK